MPALDWTLGLIPVAIIAFFVLLNAVRRRFDRVGEAAGAEPAVGDDAELPQPQHVGAARSLGVDRRA